MRTHTVIIYGMHLMPVFVTLIITFPLSLILALFSLEKPWLVLKRPNASLFKFQWQTWLQTQRWWMHTLLDCSKQSCFIDKVLRRVSFQWMHENHPSIILILVHYDIQHESLHSEKDPLLLLLLGSRTEFSLLPNKNSQKQQNGDWYCRYGY